MKRIGRREFFNYNVLLAGVLLIAFALLSLVEQRLGGSVKALDIKLGLLFQLLIYGVILYTYFLSLMSFIHRLNDLRHSPLLMLLFFIPLVNLAFLIYISVSQSMMGTYPNRTPGILAFGVLAIAIFMHVGVHVKAEDRNPEKFRQMILNSEWSQGISLKS